MSKVFDIPVAIGIRVHPDISSYICGHGGNIRDATLYIYCSRKVRQEHTLTFLVHRTEYVSHFSFRLLFHVSYISWSRLESWDFIVRFYDRLLCRCSSKDKISTSCFIPTTLKLQLTIPYIYS